jgi:hypothetical protein
MDGTFHPRRQGDLGELSAVEWLSWVGATVFLPFGHSPDVDLVAEIDGQLIRVEVKTASYRAGDRWTVGISTRGGNQSWNGVVKVFDPERCDYLFVRVANGRRWFIPTHALECRSGLTLGGPKYSEYEIERGLPLPDRNSLNSPVPPGECLSGQKERTVNPPAMPTQVRILPPPSALRDSAAEPARENGVSGSTKVWAKRRVTIPRGPFEAAGLEVGDRLRATSVGAGEIVVRRIPDPARKPVA